MTKENIIKLLEHEKAICEKLKEEHFDAWGEALDKGDKAGAECEMEMIYNYAGQIMAYKDAIEIIKRELN